MDTDQPQQELTWFKKLASLKNSVQKKFTSLRNCGLVICCWALIGSVAAASIAISDSTRFIIFIVMIYAYLFAYCLRQASFVRKRLGESMIYFCTTVFGFVGLILVSRFGVTQLNVYVQMRIGASVFAFVEIMRPICDFGAVPFFLGLPVEKAFEQHKYKAEFIVFMYFIFVVPWLLMSNVAAQEEHLENRDDRINSTTN